MDGQNGPEGLEHMIRGAAQQAQAEQLLAALLQQTMRQPAVQHRAPTSLVDVANSDSDPRVKVLLAALPNGERWEIDLSPMAQRQIVKALGGVLPVEDAG